MAERHRILCIDKPERYSPFEHITHIGGKNADGARWRITQEKAIAGIESGQWEFYVSQGGKSVNVVVATSRYGNKYLKTVADGETPDNLLSLDACMV